MTLLNLIDFKQCQFHQDESQQEDSDHHLSEFQLLKFLQEKLRIKKFAKKAFSIMNSELIHVMESKNISNHQEDSFRYTCDVVISYNYNSIIFSDYGNDIIYMFDLESKQFVSKIKTWSAPSYLCLEENYVKCYEEKNNGKDALIIGFESHKRMLKCDLEKLLQNPNATYKTKEPTNAIIWSYDFDAPPQGIAVKNHQLFIALSKDNVIVVMDSCTTKIICKIQLTFEPHGLAFESHGSLLCTTFENNLGYVYVFNEDGKNDWRSTTRFGSDQLCLPYTLTCDKVANHIIVTDVSKSSIVIFTQDGQCVKYFQHPSLKEPFGVCLNERQGELIVCDHTLGQVLVFK